VMSDHRIHGRFVEPKHALHGTAGSTLFNGITRHSFTVGLHRAPFSDWANLCTIVSPPMNGSSREIWSAIASSTKPRKA
jgi:hypothetical protein